MSAVDGWPLSRGLLKKGDNITLTLEGLLQTLTNLSVSLGDMLLISLPATCITVILIKIIK